MPPLAFARVGVRADISTELRHIAEQEGRQAQSAAPIPARSPRIEGQFARSMQVGGHAQIVGAANVRSEFNCMGGELFGRVADNLKLILVLVKRAAAAIDELA